jgi:uncharacterized membrane protein YjjB (DUF3815 family)
MIFWTTLLYQSAISFVATVGFAVLYNAPRRALIYCGAIGMGGHLLRLTLQQLGMADGGATFIAASLVGLVGAYPARRLQLPMILFAITGILPMIPGIPAYKVLVYFSDRDLLNGMRSGVEALFRVGAIAIGIGTARILTDAEWWFERN